MCRALPGKLSTTTTASKPSGKINPPFFSLKKLLQLVKNKQIEKINNWGKCLSCIVFVFIAIVKSS
jgi:hypothetical protein